MLKTAIYTSLATGMIATAYQPAMASPGAERLSVKTYEVKVKGSTRDDRDEVLDEALYKAAKRTLAKDYDWFRVVSRDFETDKTETRSRNRVRGSYELTPERRCGLLGCSTSYRRTYGAEASSDFYDREEVRHTVRLEFKMGTGSVDYSDNVYNARRVKDAY